MTRKQIAERVWKDAEHYMVCVACRSILSRSSITVCPVCKAYAFDYRIEAIRHVAEALGNQKEDSTLPYL